MSDLIERIAAVEVELNAIVGEAKLAPEVFREIGRLSMAQFWVTRVLEEERQRVARLAAMSSQPGGMDYSLPVGDR